MRLAGGGGARGAMRGGGAGWLANPVAWVIAGAAVLQLAVLAGIRLFAADPTGGDMCRDAVAMRRIVHGLNPYVPITGCGTLNNLPHPPAFLLLIGPFTLLPIALGALLWDLGALAAIAASLALIARELRLTLNAWWLGLLAVLLIFWPPLLGTLLEAQISPVLLLLCTLAWRWARAGRSVPAGIALGLAAAIRLFPGLAVLYFVVRRDWRAVLAAGAAFVVSEALALPLIGVHGYVDYLTKEAPATSAEWLINAHNVSAWGLAGMVFAGNSLAGAVVSAPGLARGFAEVLLVVLVGGLLLATWARRARSFREDEGTFLAYLPAMLLASPLTWTHYFVLLLLPIVVLGARVGWLGTAQTGEAAPERARVAAVASGGAAGPGSGARRWLAGRMAASAAEQVVRLRWLLGAALALIWINDIIARMAVPHPQSAVYGMLVLALPAYALILLCAALLLMDMAPAKVKAGRHAWRRAARTRPAGG